MVSINTNLSSLIVQNNLTQSTNALNTAIERMTTGYKINHSSDNAAGYSIAQNMNSKLNSYGVAQDNASMGLDMLKTSMDSMELITSNLQRIRDLAEQASNGTYGQESLDAINSEVQARAAEINRIIANTEYNGISLLGASSSESDTQKVTGSFLAPVEQLTEEEAIAEGYSIIKTADELQAMQDDLNGKYILMNDIDLNGYDWEPVGSLGFCGELNGNGHVIKNLTAGLFEAPSGATFKTST